MPFNNDINDFLVPAQDAFLYQLVYDKVYGGRTGCTVNINGTTVQMGANSSIDILVETISGGTGCLVSGDRPYVFGDSPQYKYVPQTFVSVWDTSRTSTGSSTATQIRLPLNSSGSYNFIVEWGDGSIDRITTWNQAETTHTYASAGVYQLTITGTLRGFRFANTGDRLKILSIFRWGTGFRIGGDGQHFFGCANLDLSEVEDVPLLAGTTCQLNSSFRGCTRLTTVNRMNEWDVSCNISLDATFYDSPNFNTYIGDWDTSNVNTMTNCFQIQTSVNIPGRFNQDISKWDTSKVTNMSNMFFNQIDFNQDIGTKLVTKQDSITYVAWDISNVTTLNAMLGVVMGSFTGSFNNGGSPTIGNWNTSKVTTIQTLFQRQRFFNQDVGTKVVTVNGVTYTAWDTKEVTNMSFTFNSTIADGVFNNGGSPTIGNWNTSKVTNMQTMFQGQRFFNQDIGTKVVTVSGSPYVAWDISNVTTIANLFNMSRNDGVFNNGGSPTIGNWNTSRVNTMVQLFLGQPYFNQDISTKVVTVSGSPYIAWNTASVTTMSFMFYCYGPTIDGRLSGNFNQNIGNWNTSSVTNMAAMFFNQPNFNQDISTKVVTVSGSSYIAWNTASATTMSFMFGSLGVTGTFNQNIGNWNTSRVTNMSNMFQNQVDFNQNIGTKQVTVSASTYSAWTVSGVTNMDIMFGISDPSTTGGLVGSFNNSGSTSINNWDVRRLTGATDMFNYQIGFNQPIGNWNISGVTRFSSTGLTTGFMLGKTFNDYSTANYDALLIGWATRNVRPNQLLNMGTIKYTSAAVSARNTLTSAPNNWTIIDGGLA